MAEGAGMNLDALRRTGLRLLPFRRVQLYSLAIFHDEVN
jgi:hypothetical protein